MDRPKAVVFDLGKVLLHFDYRIAVKRLQSHCRLSPRALQELIDQSPLLLRYESNLLTTDEFFLEIRTASGFGGGLEEFAELFCDIFTPIEPMVQLHGELRSAGVPTYVFSNTNELAVNHIRQRYPFFKQFDGYILSYEHGIMKPDARAYEVVEKVSGQRGPELLYIDDRPENVEAGRIRGWTSILHTSPEATRAEVHRTGLL